jgi:hypothetical protein
MTSKYAHPCPVCGTVIPPRGFSWEPTFSCPSCGTELKFDTKSFPIVWLGAFLAAPILAWHLGYRGLVFVSVTAGVTLLVSVLGFFALALVVIPGYKPVTRRVTFSKSKRFDRALSLRLTDKPDSGEPEDRRDVSE